jgi:hypothetical protein
VVDRHEGKREIEEEDARKPFNLQRQERWGTQRAAGIEGEGRDWRWAMIVNTNDLLTVSIAARCAGISRQTLYHWLRLGKLDRVEISGRLFVRGSQLQRIRPGCVCKRRSR